MQPCVYAPIESAAQARLIALVQDIFNRVVFWKASIEFKCWLHNLLNNPRTIRDFADTLDVGLLGETFDSQSQKIISRLWVSCPAEIRAGGLPRMPYQSHLQNLFDHDKDVGFYWNDSRQFFDFVQMKHGKPISEAEILQIQCARAAAKR